MGPRYPQGRHCINSGTKRRELNYNPTGPFTPSTQTVHTYKLHSYPHNYVQPHILIYLHPNTQDRTALHTKIYTVIHPDPGYNLSTS